MDMICKNNMDNTDNIKEAYTCEECSFTTSWSEDLQTHKLAHVKLLACDQCGYITAHATNMESHMLNHTNEKTFACPICNLSFTDMIKFCNHVQTHNPVKGDEDSESDNSDATYREKQLIKKRKKLGCNECDYTSRRIQFLQSHKAKCHKVKVKKKYACEQCDFSSKLKRTFKKHRLMHPAPTSYSCRVCSQVLKTAITYKQHMQRHICTNTADPKDALKIQPPIHRCPFCEYTTTKNSNLTSHVRRHTGEKPYACNLCSYITSQKAALQTHQLIHSGLKPFKCERCEFSARKASALTVHVRTHTGERPYGCSYCDYRGINRASIIKHVRTHTGEKPYACAQCNFTCSYASGLRNHKLTHSADKPHACQFCEYTCCLLAQLRTHMRRHSEEEQRRFAQALFEKKNRLHPWRIGKMKDSCGRREAAEDRIGPVHFLDSILPQEEFRNAEDTKDACCREIEEQSTI